MYGGSGNPGNRSNDGPVGNTAHREPTGQTEQSTMSFPNLKDWFENLCSRFVPSFDGPETIIQVKCGGKSTIIGSESVMKEAKIDVEAGKTSEIYAVPSRGSETMQDEFGSNGSGAANQCASVANRKERRPVSSGFTPNIKVKAGEGSTIVGTTDFVNQAYIKTSSRTGVNTIRAVDPTNMSETTTHAVGCVEKRPNEVPQQLALPNNMPSSARALPAPSDPIIEEDCLTPSQEKATPTNERGGANPNSPETDEINEDGFVDVSLDETPKDGQTPDGRESPKHGFAD